MKKERLEGTMVDVLDKLASRQDDGFVTFEVDLVADQWDRLAAKTAVYLLDNAPDKMTQGDLLNTIAMLQFWVLLLMGIGTADQVRSALKQQEGGGDANG